MIYVGIIIAIIVFVVLKSGNSNTNEKAEKKEMTVDTKIVLFLLGIMILGAIGGTRVRFFSSIGDLAFIAFIVFLGYLLFKKLFKK